MEQYQDIWIKGNINKGIRECSSRYEAIKPYLEKFKRPFTVLDIGANLGYFSFRIASDFPNSTCVMIENDYGKVLTELAELNDLKNVIVLNTTVNVNILERLADTEHFDVVLALNVIHHIGRVDDSISAIERIGETIIVETPSPDDSGSCGQKYLGDIFSHVSENYEHLGAFSRHTSKTSKSIMGVFKHMKSHIRKKYWDSDYRGDLGIENINIESTTDYKTYSNIRSGGKEARPWISGINFRTFQYLNGTYPLQLNLIDALKKLDLKNHCDVAPWNIIISGQNLTLIDINDPRYRRNPPDGKKRIQKIIEDLSTGRVSSLGSYLKRK
jgi:SAM-dependent methyltransferase